MTKPPITKPDLAKFVRGLIPDPLWQRMNAGPVLAASNAGLFGDAGALGARVGPGAPCRLLFVSVDWDGAFRCQLWEATRGGVKTIADEAVRSTEFVLLLERWARDFLS